MRIKRKIKKKNGITLISLVVTIIVLLILAGISISMLTGQNGILNKARESIDISKETEEKDIVAIAVQGALVLNTEGTIEQVNLQQELDNLIGQTKTQVESIGDAFEIFFVESERFYVVDNIGKVTPVEKVIDKNPGNITVSQDGTTLEGSKTSPYEIYSVEDLVAFSQMSKEGEVFVGKYIKLMNSLNLKSNYSYVDPLNTELFGDYNEDEETEGIKKELNKISGQGFYPIENFQGIFVGNNNSIEEIYINYKMTSTDKCIGLFKKMYGSVENLAISGDLQFDVENGERNIFYIGGLSGYTNGNITNITNKINISGQVEKGVAWLYIGGISGYIQGNLDRCLNIGNMNITGVADNRAAGIVSVTGDNSYITNSINQGNIKVESSDFSCIGGISLEPYSSTISNCTNLGTLEAKSISKIYIAGVASIPVKVVVEGCYNKGDLIADGGKVQIGGIISSPSGESSILNCYNAGNLYTKSNSTNIYAGGIMGQNSRDETTIKNSYNIGNLDIKGSIYRLGLVYGNLRGTIDNCYCLEQNSLPLGGHTLTTMTNTEIKNSDSMKEESFINILNKNATYFKKDEQNKNEGYPILIWQ